MFFGDSVFVCNGDFCVFGWDVVVLLEMCVVGMLLFIVGGILGLFVVM